MKYKLRKFAFRYPRSILLMVGALILVTACTPAGTASHVPLSPSPLPTVTPASIPCTLLHVEGTQTAALGAQFEGIGHISGPATAPVTIIVFSDYQCPSCAFLAGSLKQIRLAHPDDLRMISLQAPQTGRDKDTLAIQAAEAAHLQEKFWEMNDLLFEKLNEWTALPPADFETWAAGQAAGLGLDASRFKSDFESSAVADKVQQALQFTQSAQAFTTPLLFVNSASPYTGLADFASLDMVVRLETLTARQFSVCPARSIDPLKQTLATLHTLKGDVVLQLYPDQAPLAVNSFVFLARQGWYDGITFYRVTSNGVVMTGDPSETGLGNPGYLFQTEIASGLSFDQPGVVALDNNGPDTNGSRFFITLASQPDMDGQYTIFGQVLSGLDVLAALSAREPQPGIALPPGDALISVTIAER